MNAEKAREYFSVYLEGALEPGLAQALERRFAADARLREDFEAFKSTMASLEALSRPVPEPDFDLHERITARIDRDAWEHQQKVKPGFYQWWRSLAVGGLVTMALVATLIQINRKGATTDSSIASSSDLSGQIRLKQENSGLVFRYLSNGVKRVQVKDGLGSVRQSKLLVDNQTLISALTNNTPQAAILEIDVKGESPTYVAVPGSLAAHNVQGEGQFKDFALAIADHFRVPVALHGVDLQKSITWKFDSLDAFQTVQKQLNVETFGIEKREGVIWIIGQ